MKELSNGESVRCVRPGGETRALYGRRDVRRHEGFRPLNAALACGHWDVAAKV